MQSRVPICAQAIEDEARPIACDVDATQRGPRVVERCRESLRMLQRERSECLAVAASPRLLPRMIEREKLLEAR
jgi:hypothetical protein